MIYTDGRRDDVNVLVEVGARAVASLLGAWRMGMLLGPLPEATITLRTAQRVGAEVMAFHGPSIPGSRVKFTYFAR